jgi:hypothetical protein
MQERILLNIQSVYGSAYIRNLFFSTRDKFVDASSLDNPRSGFLRLWQEALFSLKQYGFSVFLEIGVSKNLGASPVNHLSGPQVLAPHAVGIG